MTRRREGNYLSTSRVKGLQQFVKASLSAYELGEILWPGHKMAKVNARAIVRELLLGEYIKPVADIDSIPGSEKCKFHATEKSASILANPPWLCRYCSTDVSNSMKRLWHHPCITCDTQHQACRFCRKQLLKATGDFPYVTKLRGCPGTVSVVQRPIPKLKKKKEVEVQRDLV